MSTKIYTGFSWDCTDFGRVMNTLRKLEPRIRTACNVRKATVLARMATETIDGQCFTLAEGARTAEYKVVGSPLSEAADRMRERQAEIRKTMYRDPGVDFEVRIVMWYVPQESRFIGYVLGEDDDDTYRMLRRCRGVTDFGYWNNVDPPKGMSRERWEARRVLWNRVFDKKLGPPLVVTVDADYWASPESIEAQLPSFEKRVTEIARHAAFRPWLEREHPALLHNSDDDETFSTRVSTYMCYEREVRRPGTTASQLVEEQKARVAQILPVDIRPLLRGYTDERVQGLLKAGGAKEASVAG